MDFNKLISWEQIGYFINGLLCFFNFMQTKVNFNAKNYQQIVLICISLRVVGDVKKIYFPLALTYKLY